MPPTAASVLRVGALHIRISFHIDPKIGNDFLTATMHFNHFVKPHDCKSIDKESLLMTRGVGVLCANNHTSIDAVNVFFAIWHEVERRQPRSNSLPNQE